MVGFCLPKKESAKFLAALRSGELNPSELSKKTSVERKEIFSKVLGEDTAQEVNALFESKLLLKDQRAGMRNWMDQLLGLNEKTKRSIEDQINSLRRVLNPKEEKDFLASLAAKKLGTEVTAEEAKAVFDLSEKTRVAKEELSQDPDNWDKRMAYGYAKQDMLEKVRDLKKPGFDPRDWKSYSDVGSRILGSPRSVMSSVDLSAPFVQGWGSMTDQRFWQAFTQMHKYFSSEKGYRDLISEIVSDPDYEIMRKANLALTDIGDDIHLREENFQSNLPEELVSKISDLSKKYTGVAVPNFFRASDRGFSGFLNYVRYKRFKDLVSAARLLGDDVKLGSQVTKDIAKVINDATGRGAIGKGDSWGHLGPLLANIFFAPRKISADLNFFNPANFVTLSPVARTAWLKSMTGSLLATGGIIGLLHAMGGKVQLNPEAQDFGMVEFGKTKFDFTGGKRLWVREFYRMMAQQKISSSGKVINFGEGYKPTTSLTELGDFARNKLAPVASGVVDFLAGSNAVGQPFKLTDEVKERFVPMTMGSFIDLYQSGETNPEALALAFSTVYGVNMQSPFISQRMGLTPWGEDANNVNHDEEDPLNDTLQQLGYFNKPGHAMFPPKTINGVKLTDGQYHDYIALSGSYAKQALLPLVKSDQWSKLPPQAQESLAHTYIEFARTKAQSAIIQSSIGSNNDILANIQKKAQGIQ